MTGEEIKEWRSRLKLSQEGLAQLIGVTMGSVNRWEAGTTKPSKLALEKINKLIEEQNAIKRPVSNKKNV